MLTVHVLSVVSLWIKALSRRNTLWLCYLRIKLVTFLQYSCDCQRDGTNTPFVQYITLPEITRDRIQLESYDMLCPPFYSTAYKVYLTEAEQECVLFIQ